MKRTIKVLSLLLALTMLASCGSGRGKAESNENAYAVDSITHDGGTLPGNIQPYILYLDKEYVWDGMSTAGRIDDALDTRKLNEITTILPTGYFEVGELASVYYDIPKNDLDFAAGFKASGIVYANAENQNIIIVLMTTDWFSDQYVKFVVR